MADPKDPKDLELTDFMSPDYGTMGQTIGTFKLGMPRNTSAGLANDFDIFGGLVTLLEDHYSPDRVDDGVTGRRIAKIVYYEILQAEDVTDPILSILNASSPAGEEISEVFVVYAAPAGGSTSMLTPPEGPTDFSRIYRLPRFYSIQPSNFEPTAWVGQQCWVEFLDKDLYTFGLFKGMTNDSTAMFEPGKPTSAGASPGPSNWQPSADNPVQQHAGFPPPPLPAGTEGKIGVPSPMVPERRRNDLIKELSDKVGLDWLIALAFIGVESGHRAFLNPAPGRRAPIAIRFEPHVFAKGLWRKDVSEGFTLAAAGRGPRVTKFKADPRGWWVDPQRRGWSAALIRRWRAQGHHHGQKRDQDFNALMYATRIDEDIAYRSSSYGLPQVMGFNHKKMGYKSAKEMFWAFAQSESAQIHGFFNYIARMWGGAPLRNLQLGNWMEAVYRYNGIRNQAYVDKLLKYIPAYRAGKLPKNPPLREAVEAQGDTEIA